MCAMSKHHERHTSMSVHLLSILRLCPKRPLLPEPLVFGCARRIVQEAVADYCRGTCRLCDGVQSRVCYACPCMFGYSGIGRLTQSSPKLASEERKKSHPPAGSVKGPKRWQHVPSALVVPKASHDIKFGVLSGRLSNTQFPCTHPRR